MLTSLRCKRDFHFLRQEGQVWRCALFKAVYSIPSAQKETSSPIVKIGVVIPKKIAKHAVVRNRIRRRIKEALRATLPGRERSVECLLFLPRMTCYVKPFSEIQSAMVGMLTKIARSQCHQGETERPTSVRAKSLGLAG